VPLSHYGVVIEPGGHHRTAHLRAAVAGHHATARSCLELSDEADGIIHFLRCSTDHHNIGLVHSPVPILQHYSWECDDLDHVGHTATALYRGDPSRHAWGIGRHFAGSNFYWYLRDPSGNKLCAVHRLA